MINLALLFFITAAPVVGLEKSARFPIAAKEALAKDGFTVLEGKERHFFSLYDRNAYEKVPSFITADVVLHVFHTRFDEDLAGFERTRLIPALRAFSTAQLQRALQVLHVGVGDVDELWVVVPRAGQQVLMRGGVFSFYEFTRADRLTDALFIDELQSASPPPRPFWARPVPTAPPAQRRKD